jgi:hypothetical protein
MPGLRLQDLTRDDIKLYVSDTLEKGLHRQQILTDEPEDAKWLIGEVVDKAAGVFLWVTLVVKTLINGLRNGDEISDLRRELASLPPDLEKLYERMIQSIESKYKEEALKRFLLFRASQHNLDIPTLERALRFSDYRQAIEMTALRGGMSYQERRNLRRRCQRLAVRLNSRCKGLLEVP